MALYENLSENYQLLESGTWQFGGVQRELLTRTRLRLFEQPLTAAKLTLSLIYPGDSINEIVLSCRDRARDLLRSGVPLQSVMRSGLTEVELLFRMRQQDEEWNVPGWACEVGLPESATLQHFYKLPFMANGSV
jgi:hypothetical protein